MTALSPFLLEFPVQRRGADAESLRRFGAITPDARSAAPMWSRSNSASVRISLAV
jgi:hypothetical protein